MPCLRELEGVERPECADVGVRQAQHLSLQLRELCSTRALPVQVLQALHLERIGVAQHELLAQCLSLAGRRWPSAGFAFVLVESQGTSLASAGRGGDRLLFGRVGGKGGGG